MEPFGRKALIHSFRLLDLLLMSLAFLLAVYVIHLQSNYVSFEEFLSMRVKIQNFLLFLAILYGWYASMEYFMLYQSRRLYNLEREIIDILKAISLGTLLLFLMGKLFRISLITPNFLMIFWLSSMLAVTISRVSLRFMLAMVRRRGRNLRSVVIVGTNPKALQFGQKIQERTELGYRVWGFVDDEWNGIQEIRQTNFPLKGNLAEFPAILREHVIDEVVVSLPMKSLYEEAARIVSLCEEQGVIVRFLSDILFNLKFARATPEMFENTSLLTFYPCGIIGWEALAKRAIDFSFSLALLLVFSPLLAFITLAIKFSSSGPVFFVQERLGLNKRRFRLFKFRTMVPDAEAKIAELEHLNEVDGPAFKIKDDPRVTKIGKILRRTSFDELPQLINVLKGDMSLVGPRPLPVRDYNGFNQDWQRRRFSVTPGLTCLWQVNGRSNLDFEKWMQLDMEYIDHWSLWLDLKILFWTIPAVLKGSGAS
jgi:exopolysaccharide biosynthesis polyprenyl glycosylphosphotransferase